MNREKRWERDGKQEGKGEEEFRRFNILEILERDVQEQGRGRYLRRLFFIFDFEVLERKGFEYLV